MPGYILWKNHADTASLSTTSGTMLRALTQLQVPWAKGLARGPVDGGPYAVLDLRADLGSAKRIQCVGIIGMNGVTQVDMTVSLSNVALGSAEIGSGSASIDTTNTPEAFGDAATIGQNLFHFFPDFGLEARYVTIELIAYGRAALENYVDARRLMIVEGGVFDLGFDFDWAANPIDQTESVVTPKGGVFVSENETYREMVFSISGMTVGEAKTNSIAVDDTDSLQRVIVNAGRKREVIVSPRLYTDDSDQTRDTIYGRLVSWSPIVHTGGDTYACDSIVVDETPSPALS